MADSASNFAIWPHSPNEQSSFSILSQSDTHIVSPNDVDEDDQFDDPPPIYDVAARLKEINEALAKEVLPDDSASRQLKVTFRENPVELEIPAESSDEEGGGGDGCDQQNGTENSSDSTASGHKQTEGLPHANNRDSMTTIERKPDEDDATQCTEDEHADNIPSSAHFPMDKLGILASRLAKDLILDAIQLHSSNTYAINLKESREDYASQCHSVSTNCRTSNDHSINGTVTLNASNNNSVSANERVTEVQGESVDVTTTMGSVTPVESSAVKKNSREEVLVTKSSKDNLEVMNGKNVNNADLKEQTDASSLKHDQHKKLTETRLNKTRLLPSRPCAKETRLSMTTKAIISNDEETTLVMASKGKFHVVNLESLSCDTPRLKRTSCSAQVKKPKNLGAEDPVQRTSSSRVHSSLRETYTEAMKTSVPSRRRTTRRPHTADQSLASNGQWELTVRHTEKSKGGSYGLTPEQKEEKEKRLHEIAEERQMKKLQDAEAMEAKRRQSEKAFRQWLSLKRNTSGPSNSHTNPTSTNDNVHMPESMGDAFRDWLRRKRQQKAEEQRLEELRLQQEQEVYCKKTKADNERAFREWLRKKVKSQCVEFSKMQSSSRLKRSLFGGPYYESFGRQGTSNST